MKQIIIILTFILSTVCAFAGNNNDSISKNPDAVLIKAREYVEKKEYKKALDGYLWFFNNAANIQESLWAVKLSYCLSEWRELGNHYEPALVAFREELLKRKERLDKGENNLWLFIEFNSFCQLDNKWQTVIDMFIKYHNGKNKEFARAIFPQIKEELLERGYYNLCSEYVENPIQLLNEVKSLYDIDKETFNEEALFLLTVLKKSNRDSEYKQLKRQIIKLELAEGLMEKINLLENN